MDSSVVLKVLGLILWPLVALAAVFVFRRPFTRLASEIAARTSKVTFKGVSLELQTLPMLTATWRVSWPGGATEDVRRLTSSMLFDSYSQTLFEELLHPKDADYAVVDLGRGEAWLTSRLYIFSLVLGEVSRLSALVFVETADGVRRRFLGVAGPGDVRAALARRYPWLEQAFALAYVAQYPRLGDDLQDQSTLSSQAYVLDPNQTGRVMQLVRTFIDNIQRKTQPPQSEQTTYLSFQTTTPGIPGLVTLWERGQWIDGERLERDLVGCIGYSYYADSPDLSRRARIDGILRRAGHFIALVDEDRRFAGLVNRYALLERSLPEREESNERHVVRAE